MCSPRCHAFLRISTLRCAGKFKAVYLFPWYRRQYKVGYKKKDLHVMFFLLNFDLLEMLLSACTVTIKAPVKWAVCSSAGFGFEWFHPGMQWRRPCMIHFPDTSRSVWETAIQPSVFSLLIKKYFQLPAWLLCLGRDKVVSRWSYCYFYVHKINNMNAQVQLSRRSVSII